TADPNAVCKRQRARQGIGDREAGGSGATVVRNGDAEFHRRTRDRRARSELVDPGYDTAGLGRGDRSRDDDILLGGGIGRVAYAVARTLSVRENRIHTRSVRGRID